MKAYLRTLGFLATVSIGYITFSLLFFTIIYPDRLSGDAGMIILVLFGLLVASAVSSNIITFIITAISSIARFQSVVYSILLYLTFEILFALFFRRPCLFGLFKGNDDSTDFYFSLTTFITAILIYCVTVYFRKTSR